MRKVIVSEIISLDGFFAGQDGDLTWHVVDEDVNRQALDVLGSADLLLFGRATYELMVRYWPTQATATEDSIIAEKMNTLPKVVSWHLKHTDEGGNQ
jgi:dihydrofolate reductase